MQCVFVCTMMGRSMKDIAIIFLLLLSSGHGESSHVVCQESEKQALLSFKQELKDPSKRLSSWDAETDCCTWVGVVCHNLAGHVIQLQLRNPYPDDESLPQYEAYEMSKLGGKISPSLVDLKHLNHLDLSRNDFGGIPIPSFIGSLPSLQYLNLSKAGFEGAIPHELGNLTSLRVLSLGGPFLYPEFELNVKSLQWLASLSSLEHLDMSHVNLNSTSNWLQVLNMLPSLVELKLSYCALSRVPPLLDVNFTSLAVLDISGNEFHSSIPGWIFSLSSLVSLNLSSNGFEGPIPDGLLNLTSLRYLHMSMNNFNSTIPDWLYSLSRLKSLDLSNNKLQGIISRAVGNLTSAVMLDLSYNQLEGRVTKSLRGLCNLRFLDLSGNKFGGQVSEIFQILLGCISDALEFLYMSESKLSGHLTDQLAQFKSLCALYLDSNSISGPIPASLGSLSSLRMLDLEENQLIGTLPESLGQLSKLEFLRVSNNFLEGVVTEVHFANLTSLRQLYASNNRLVLTVNPDWIPPFQCHSMDLSSWNLGDKFPSWLRAQEHLVYLDLSSTGISDSIPDWFWSLTSSFMYLNLSHNNIHGRIPDVINCDAKICMIHLSSNQFSGPLPRLSSSVTALDLSSNSFSGDLSQFLCDSKNEPNKLEILYLEENLLFGKIPDCWMNWRSLKVVNLGGNNLTGSLPSSMGLLDSLQSLHLRNNSLSGEIPVSLRTCTELLTLDLSENQFVGSIPSWMEQLSKLMFFNCRSNKLHGQIPREFCHLTSLQILDLSNNNLSGVIPQCVNNFTAMAAIPGRNPFIGRYGLGGISYSSYSGPFLENAFVVAKGRELEYSTILTLVTSIDLSNNNIDGEITEELTNLLELRFLNLSGNCLKGSVPEKIGNMRSLESLDLSRNQLSGQIPPSMVGLTFLNYLNFSSNNLTGKIPQSTQLQSLDASCFAGNHLCGPPLLQNCSLNGVRSDGEDEDEETRVHWFYVNAAFGFVLCFWGVFGPILFCQHLRRTYFIFLDHLWERICIVKGRIIKI